MLSRSSFSIRRLISHRRTRSIDEDCGGDYSVNGDSHGGNDDKGNDVPVKRQKTWSWVPPRNRTKYPTKKEPVAIVILREPASVKHISQPPRSLDTPYSSKSSLCSCEDCNTASAAGLSTRGTESAWCSLCPFNPEPGSKSSHDSNRPTSTQGHDGRRSPQPISRKEEEMPLTDFPAQLSKSGDSHTTLQPQQPSPLDSRRAGTAVQLEGVESSSDNIQQLIRETDEAFKSVGVAIAQAELGIGSFRSTGPEQSIRKWLPRSPALPPMSTRRLSSKGGAYTLKSPTRSGSVSKPRRKRSQKARRKPAVPPKKAPKWASNAKELINSRLFNRIEVDEVLPQSRLQEIRMRTSQLQVKKSTETLKTIETDGSDTPLEPFHLQDLPSRIGAAGVVTTALEEESSPDVADVDTKAVDKDDQTSQNTRSHIITSPFPDALSNSPQSGNPSLRDISFPSSVTPSNNATRFPGKRQLPLPTILEVIDSGTPGETVPPRSEPGAQHDETFIFLPCTPYTQNVPTFRHGPIRLAVEDVALTYGTSRFSTNTKAAAAAAAAVDDSLDWTAFQMAILGGAGDLSGETSEYGRRTGNAADEAEDLCTWFDSFGFESYGRLISATCAAAVVSKDSTISDAEKGGWEADSEPMRAETQTLPIPVELEHPSGFWNEGRFDSSRFYAARSFGVRRWTTEGHPKRYERHPRLGGRGRHLRGLRSAGSRRQSTESVPSLPQSPMPDLGTDCPGIEALVPMGYNLGHDLGDFLRWEAENVYALGFHGPQES
ncbi:hypothetical protein VTK73DRAFT_7687 [Phialemonium thermophilum]|uniref:Uncharacterized protein n=1 Tax=Phialemonium thermophilum TaxID=223376 RepID=A0ABR3XS92_9PEZI